jgi:hypothetical protein
VNYGESANTPNYDNINSDFGNAEASLLALKSSDSVVGVALNGVLLFAGTSEYGYDAFFP